MAGSYPVHTDTPQSHLWSEMYHRLDIFLPNHIHSDMWSVIHRTDRSSVSPTVYSAHSHFRHSLDISYVHFVDQIQHFHHSLHIYKSYCYLLLFLPLYKRFCVHYFVSMLALFRSLFREHSSLNAFEKSPLQASDFSSLYHIYGFFVYCFCIFVTFVFPRNTL